MIYVIVFSLLNLVSAWNIYNRLQIIKGGKSLSLWIGLYIMIAGQAILLFALFAVIIELL